MVLRRREARVWQALIAASLSHDWPEAGTVQGSGQGLWASMGLDLVGDALGAVVAEATDASARVSTATAAVCVRAATRRAVRAFTDAPANVVDTGTDEMAPPRATSGAADEADLSGGGVMWSRPTRRARYRGRSGYPGDQGGEGVVG